VAAPRVTGWAAGALLGAVYGLVLWVLGPLLLMPARMGMSLFTVDAMAVQSLYGHLVFGVVLGALVVRAVAVGARLSAHAPGRAAAPPATSWSSSPMCSTSVVPVLGPRSRPGGGRAGT